MSKGRSLIEEVLSNETACGRLGIVDVESIEQSIVKLREAIEVAAQEPIVSESLERIRFERLRHFLGDFSLRHPVLKDEMKHIAHELRGISP